MDELSSGNRPAMDFRIVRDDDGAPRVTISGELDIANVDELEAAVRPIIERRPERLVLDVKDLQFADTSAIALWVRWASEVDEIELLEPPALLRRVLEAMGLGQKLRVRS